MAKLLCEFIKEWSFEQLQKKKAPIFHSAYPTDGRDRTPESLTGSPRWARAGSGLVVFRARCVGIPTPQ